MDDYLFRSLLFVPAHVDKLLISATKAKADTFLFDIEDSVQPESNKQVAREKLVDYITRGEFDNAPAFVRVNDSESGHLLKDIMSLTIDGINGFMYPKSKRGEDIYFFDKLLETIEYEKGIPIGTFKIIPLIETTSAVLHVEEICRASPRVVAVAYGSEDFVSDLQGIHDEDHLSLFMPRAKIAMAGRAVGIPPIDTVHVRVKDLEDLEVNLKLSRKLGFEGMMALHPMELPLIHKYYSPSAEEIAHSKEIIASDIKARESGVGVAIINGKFIGPPFVAKANKILKKDIQIKSRHKQ